jgi:gas vesicle protein
MAKFGSFLTGFIAGAAVGLLYAPRKGSEIRDILSRPLEDIKEKADDLADEFKESKFSGSSGKRKTSEKQDRRGHSESLKSSSGKSEYSRTGKGTGYSAGI